MRRSLIPLLVVALMSLPAVPAAAVAPDGPTVTARGAAAPPAARKAKTKKVERPYVQNWVFRSKKLKRCIFFEARGTIVGRWRYAYGEQTGDRDTLLWSNIKLRNPSVTAVGWPIKGRGCDSTKRWKMEADLAQGWFQAGCDLKVSLSAGVPWSVSATPEYSCGDERVGHRTSTEGPSRKKLAQYNSGAPVRFSSSLASVRYGGIGFRGVISVRAHTKNASDYVKKPINVTLNK